MILPAAKEERWTNGNPVYNEIPLGHNTIGNMMKEIFTTAKMFQIYNNHSIRATASKSSTMQRHLTGLFAVYQDTGMSTASWATAEICIKKCLSLGMYNSAQYVKNSYCNGLFSPNLGLAQKFASMG